MNVLLIICVFITLELFYPNSVNCITCYQCNSTDHENPFQCTEFLDSSVDLQPKECSAVYNAAYCIKEVGRFEGGLGTKRFCSSLDLGNYCNYIKQPGDDLEYRSCVYTCNSDGCNSTSMLTVSYSLLILCAFMRQLKIHS